MKGSVRSRIFPLRRASALAASFSARFLAATSLALAWPEAILKKVLLSLIFALDLELSCAFIFAAVNEQVAGQKSSKRTGVSPVLVRSSPDTGTGNRQAQGGGVSNRQAP